jgi:uncharacterized protein YodC (DUF2158 family)
MPAFKTGEIVQLKSGGPKITVKDAVTFSDEIHCQWFAGGKLNDGYFPKESLIKVDEDEKNEKRKS